tara:strand:+ start:720 stop:1016 length:297 start_codon:yes stop_codon:yes gene_type:complete
MLFRTRDALNAMYVGGAKCLIENETIKDWNEDFAQPTEKEIQTKLKELEKQYADNEYQRKRLEEYNAIGIGEQLDMIYHDMDSWKAKIKAVKDKYPKP